MFIRKVCSFLLGKRSVLLLCTLLVYGCVSHTPISEKINEFYSNGFGQVLLDGEKVLSYRGIITVTNESVFNVSAYLSPVDIFSSIDHVDIKTIDWEKESKWLCMDLFIYTYDSSSPKRIASTYYACIGKEEKEEITRAIQKQLEYIAKIRGELGITIPDTVTTAELRNLNAPVVKELKARPIVSTDAFQKESESLFPYDQCPDISGVYYDRALELKPGIPVRFEPDELHAQSIGICQSDDGISMSSRCSLRHWLDRTLRNRMLTNGMYTLSCPLVDKIEVVMLENKKTIKVIAYKGNEVESTSTIDIRKSGFDCKDGVLIFSYATYLEQIRLFLSGDGSIFIKKGESGPTVGFVTQLAFISIPYTQEGTESYYKWGLVGKSNNPYSNCPEVK